MNFDIIKLAPYAWRAFQQRSQIGLLVEDLAAIHEKAKPAIEEAIRRWPQMEQLVRTLVASVLHEESLQKVVLGEKGPWKPDVPWIQEDLKLRGFYKGKIDGDYGEQTRDAVRMAQRSFGFVEKDIDGLCGPQTSGAMLAHPVEHPT